MILRVRNEPFPVLDGHPLHPPCGHGDAAIRARTTTKVTMYAKRVLEAQHDGQGEGGRALGLRRYARRGWRRTGALFEPALSAAMILVGTCRKSILSRTMSASRRTTPLRASDLAPTS